MPLHRPVLVLWIPRGRAVPASLLTSYDPHEMLMYLSHVWPEEMKGNQCFLKMFARAYIEEMR